ncbi:MAG TPA: hypothetical protein GX500_05825 [Firmicutes bacterium]|nr:hypothetical protein [Candidatus Fermentithermobacillaceae bacterium]
MGATRADVLQIRTRRAAFILVVAASFVMVAGSAAFAAYPQPTGNINDFVGVLSSEDKTNLDALVNAVLDQTGVTFAVAIVPDHGDETIEQYAVHLYETWGIGKKGEDKGLLIVVSMKERDMRAEVGYGLEPVITDARAGDILDEMIPYFQQGEYGKGLYAGLLVAANYVAKDAGVTLDLKAATKKYEDFYVEPVEVPLGLIALVFGLPVLAMAYLAARGKRCPRCKSRLTVTDRVVQQATYDTHGIARTIYHCTKCGYHDEKERRIGRLQRPTMGGGFPVGPGPFWGGPGGGKGSGGFSGPRGFGGGRSGGGGASRKW